MKNDSFTSLGALASHAGVFRGARISSLRAPLKTPAWGAIGACVQLQVYSEKRVIKR